MIKPFEFAEYPICPWCKQRHPRRPGCRAHNWRS